jgi:hypothetical protein
MIYAELFKSKGTGEWHVCELCGRVWSGVSPWFKKKKDAVTWASANGYKLEKKNA